MASSTWSNLGLGWASLDTAVARARLAQALLRWDVLPVASRTALRQLVLGLGTPVGTAVRELEAVHLVSIADNGRVTPQYPGAALVALEEERRALPPTASNELLAWYQRGQFRLRKTYDPFEAERPRHALETYAELGRRQLVEQREGRRYRSTVRGWAVARLVEDASAVGEDDGPTARWHATNQRLITSTKEAAG